jgi:hypothetical protein
VVLEKDGEYQIDRSCEIEKALHIVKEERYMVHTVNRRKISGLVTSGTGTAF